MHLLEQSLLVPLDTLLLVGAGVAVALNLTGVTSEEAVQGRSDHVLALVARVALSASGLEETG